MHNPVIKVIIPAKDEAGAIGKVIKAIPDIVSEIIVANNGSIDNTAAIARNLGATIVDVPVPGYGRACLAGIEAAGPCDILVFLDGDASDFPEELPLLIDPIVNNKVDMVIGSRLTGRLEVGALTVQQIFGNRLACGLMRLFWKSEFTDLGPFRAISRSALERLDMSAETFGWTVEMQVRALKYGLICAEIPVSYRPRIGKSKISGTLSGVILAGYYILSTIFKEALRPT